MYGASSEQYPCRGWGGGGAKLGKIDLTIQIKRSIYAHMGVKRHEGIDFFFLKNQNLRLGTCLVEP